MKKKLIAIILLITITANLLLACGTSEDSPAASTQTPTDAAVDGRTLFIYMCGSNLETQQGLAGKNIDELLAADTGELNIVIQTGGAKTWRSHDISSSAIGRYEVRDGQLVLMETLEQQNMGDPQTLTDFIRWGREKYPSARSSLILWDHGAGSVKGVCFDENYSFDGLTLPELHSALEEADIKTKFEIVGFDACLMASIETAAAVSDYADYMVASEEIEPSGGWDYTALADALDRLYAPLDVGKYICDSYMEKCKSKGKDLTATLSVFDLSHTDEMLVQFDRIAETFIVRIGDPEVASGAINAVNESEKFGGDNSYQGAANMLDFYSFLQHATENISTNTTDTFITHEEFVPYCVSAGSRRVGGMSFYYPAFYNRDEVKSYIGVCSSKPYKEFLTEHYLNVPSKTIAFTDRGSIDENGAFTVALAPQGKRYLSRIDFVLTEIALDGEERFVCVDNDITKDWDNLIFKSNFRGVTLALDGHPIFYTALSSNEEYITFITPAIVNGELTSLRFAFIWDKSYFNDGYYAISGLWNGYDENGLPVNDMIPLKAGDKLQVFSHMSGSKDISAMFSEEFTIGEDGGRITEVPLSGKTYQYYYVATDIFGNQFLSDTATFEMTVSYEELLKNPLPDGEYAAKVTNVEKMEQ